MQLTATEAAALTGLQEREIRKDLELGVITSTNHPPRFEEAELVYFQARHELGFSLAPEDRRKLFELVRASLASGNLQIRIGEHWRLDLGALDAAVQDRMRRFQTWKEERVLEDPEVLGGEPVFVGSRVPVRHVGEKLLRTDLDQVQVRAEILEHWGYTVREDDLDFARLYTLAYPRIGRPRARPAP